MLRRWGKTRRGELADAGGAGTTAGTHGVVAQRRSRLLAPLSHELGGVVAEQEAARAARHRARHRSGVDRLGVSSSQQGPFEKVQDAANGFPATR